MGLWQTIKGWFGGSSATADSTPVDTGSMPTTPPADTGGFGGGGAIGDTTDVADVTDTSWGASPGADKDEGDIIGRDD